MESSRRHNSGESFGHVPSKATYTFGFREPSARRLARSYTRHSPPHRRIRKILRVDINILQTIKSSAEFKVYCTTTERAFQGCICNFENEHAHCRISFCVLNFWFICWNSIFRMLQILNSGCKKFLNLDFV